MNAATNVPVTALVRSEPRERNIRSRYASRSREGQRSSERSYPVIDRHGDRQQRADWRRENSRDYEYDYDRSEREFEPKERRKSRRSAQASRSTSGRTTRTRSVNSSGGTSSSSSESRASEITHRFYLELSSPVVDAPSIGPRMAEKLEQFDIETVAHLLAASPETLAEQLDNRRVDADTIRAWQQQATLVCRIPNLRGHDAQLLVACDMTSPEILATSDAEAVLESVTEVAESKEGQRILRGGKQPDLDEVVDWIDWAGASRSLKAA